MNGASGAKQSRRTEAARRSALKIVARGLAGFLSGLAVWLILSPPYTRLLASASQFLVRLSERPAVTSIAAEGTLMVVDRSDFPASPSTVQLAVESTDVTFNFILLATLFAASPRALSDRNVFGFVAASVALLSVHVAAVISFVKAHYVANFGMWSATHYGVAGRTIWSQLPYFYSTAGVYGCAFALWWLFRDPLQKEQNSAGRKTMS